MDFVQEHSGRGREIDWIGVDRLGHLAYFSTAGFGAIPAALAASIGAVEDLFERVLRLPLQGEAQAVSKEAINIGDWLEVAKRGLFAFDWRSRESAYFLIAKPQVGLVVDRLPDEVLRQAAALAPLPAEFSTLEKLNVTAGFPDH